MNMFKGRWPQFKQELPAFIYFVVVSPYLNFYFPAIVRLGSPLNGIVGILGSMATMYVYLAVYIFPERYAVVINLEFFNDFPDPALTKAIFRWMMLGLCFIMYSYFWYKDYHEMSNAWYVILYSHYIISFLLIDGIVQRYQEAE